MDSGIATHKSAIVNKESAKAKLVGTWQKLTEEPCSDLYPNQIEFRIDGVYLVPMENEYKHWQSGDFEIAKEGVINIQTANDETVSYHYAISEDRTLTFEDQNGCKFGYRQIR